MLQSLFNEVPARRPATLLKRADNTDLFLQNLRNFQKHLFYGTPPVAAPSTSHRSSYQ